MTITFPTKRAMQFSCFLLPALLCGYLLLGTYSAGVLLGHLMLGTYPAGDTTKPNGTTEFIDPSIYGEGCPRNVYREHFKTLLRSWESIAVRRNITAYFICFGSMLGAYRNGDIVPYDHDVDICMFRRDLHKLEPEDSSRPFKYNDGKPHMILQRHCHHPRSDTPRRDCNGKIVTKYVDACSILDPCGRILLGSPPFLDVFAIKDKGKVLLDEYRRVNHKRGVILPVKPCNLMGIRTQCPGNPKAYLMRYYGRDFASKPHYICKEGKWVATGDRVNRIVIPV